MKVGIKRTENGYQVDWRDERGKRSRETFPNHAAAKAFETEEKAEIQRRKAKGLGPRLLFREFSGEWLADIKKEAEARNKPKTYVWYEMMVRVHLNPMLGDYFMSDLTPGLLRGDSNNPG